MPSKTYQKLTKTRIENACKDSVVWDAEVRGFGLRVTATGTRTFIFLFRVNRTEQGRITIGRYPSMTVEQARKIACVHRVTVDQGRNPSRERKGAREAATLSDLAVHYCDVYGPQRGLKPQTISDARRLLNRYALPRFGRRKVLDITVGDIRSIHNDTREKVSRYQANKLRAVLSRMFTLAIQNEWRTDNPCRGVEKFQEDQRWNHLSLAQVNALLDACDRYNDQHTADGVRLLLYTGARLREVTKATWDQFDLEEGLWIKPSSHTKTKLVHRLQLAPMTVEMLQRMRFERPDSPFLFPGRDGTKPRVDLKRPWERILEAADIGHHRRHDLRRTTATFMLSTGSDLMTVGKSLGHTQASTTMRYASLIGTAQRDGITRATALMRAGAT
ncbi:site-specific integrase [soil metagenome]